MPAPARRLALQVLRELARGGNTLADALAASGPSALDERDRALLHELVLGTLRRRGWLDHVVSGLASRPLPRIDPGLLDVLRLGAYQLLFTRVPPHAALSEAVDLARAVEPRAAGMVNAVLRRLQRQGAPAPPDRVADPLRWLTTAGSLPGWLAERWLRRLGPERAVARAESLLEAPPTFFRVNPRLGDPESWLASEGILARGASVPGALELLQGRLAPALARGDVYVQDAGAQLVARLAASEGRVLDACAAPGGKSLLVSDLGRGACRVVAAEASRRRLRTLAALRERWGASRVELVAADALRPPFRVAFDAVLLDAPCSGLGTLARHPDIRWRSAPHDLARQAERQRAMLESNSGLVRPGGRLVYATCSTEPEETDEVVLPFLARHPEFVKEPLPPFAEAHADSGFVRMDPTAARGDAFFAAVLRRTG